MKYTSTNRFLAISRTLVRSGLALLSSFALHAQTSGNWNVNTSSSWGTVTNWLSSSLTGGVVPNAIDATVNFTVNITAARAITLDGNRTVGSMSVDDLTNGGTWLAYSFNPGTPTTSQLIFDVASGSAALNTNVPLNNATNSINVGITLNDPLVITTAKTNVAGGFNLAGVITDGASSFQITKEGNGSVTLGSANTYDGGTLINAGRIQANNVQSFGTGLVTVASGGQAFLATSGTFANNLTIAGDGYANTADTGALNGALRYQNGAITAGTITLSGPARIGAIAPTSTGTLSGPLTGGNVNLEINSTATNHSGNIVLLGNASGLTGTVTVTQGSLRLGTNSNLGGSVVVRDSANLYADGIGVAGGAVVAGNLTLGNSGSVSSGANLYIDPSTDDALQVNGNVTLNGINTVQLNGPLASNSMVVMTYSGTLTGSAANLTLPGGLAAFRPGTGFTVDSGRITLTLVQGEIKWSGAATNAWNTTDSNWDDNGAATTFFNTDIVTFDETTIKARFTTNLVNATNNDLVFTAKTPGLAGQTITIEYVDPGVPDSPISASVSGSSLLVSLATDASGVIISSANDVKAAIEASAPVSALISVASAAGNDGSGLVAALPISTFVLPNQAIALAAAVSPGDMLFDHDVIGYSITGAGSIIGGGSLTKQGDASLTLSTANTFAGGVMLSEGRIRVGNAAALGSGTLTIAGSQISSDSATGRTLANPLNLSGAITLGNSTDSGALIFSGAATLSADTTLNCTAANTVTHEITAALTDGAGSFRLTKGGNAHLRLLSANTYDGGTIIESSRIQADNVGSFGTGTVKVLSGGQAFFNAGGTNTNNYEIEGTGWTETAGQLGAIRLTATTLSGAIMLTGDARITAHGTTGALTGNIGETAGTWVLELANISTGTDSTITVSGNNSHSMGTTVRGATVIANHNNAFGTGLVTLQSNGTAARVTRVQLGTDVVIDNDIKIVSNAQTGFRGAVHSYSGSLTTPSLAVVNGDIEIEGAMGNGGHLASESLSLSVLRVMGAINVTNNTIPLVRLGTVELGGGGNYTELNHGEGTLRLVAANGINTASSLNLGLSGASEFDVNGFGQTLTGLTKGSFNASVINRGASASTLTLDMATSSTFGGVFAAGTSALNLVKSGTGTLALSGVSDGLVGSLVVNQGGLNLTGTLGTTSFTSALNAGTVLSGEGTFGGNVTVSGATIRANAATSSKIFATGDLTTSSGITVELTTPPITNSPIEIIACGGVLTSNAAHFSLLNAAVYRNPQFQVNANIVSLTLDAPKNLTWTGVGGNTWDVNTTSNWVDEIPAASPFFFLDQVTFNAGGGTILVPNTVVTGTFTVNSTDNWLFQGVGTIQTASIAKTGTGVATIETPWLINGPIALTAGALQFSPAAATTGSITTALSGAGSLIKGGDGILSITSANSGFTGSVVISKGEIAAGNNNAFGSASVVFGNANTQPTDICTLSVGTGIALATTQITVSASCENARIATTGGSITGVAITKRGTGKLTIGHPTDNTSTTNAVTGTSPITIESGTLAGSSMTPISASTTITMGNASTGTAPTILEVPASQSGNNDFTTLSCPLVLSAAAPNSEAIIRYAGGPSVLAPSISSNISLNGRDLYLENTSGSNLPTRLYNVSGNITGNGNVRVRAGTLASGAADGATRLRITGTGNTFTGDLYIQTGNLQTGFSTNHIPDSALVIMSAGTAMGFAATADTIRGLVGGAATEAVPFTASINQGRGDTNISRLTVSDSNAANTHVFHGRLADGAGLFALTKAGAATQVLNGVHTYTGTTIVTGGTLEIAGAGQLGSGIYSSAITLTSPGILKFNSTVDQVLQTGVISGTGALVKENSGNLTLSAANTFSGNVTVSGGKLIGGTTTNSVTVFGSRSNTRVFTINNGGTLQFDVSNVLGASHTATTAPKLVINSGGVVTNGGTANNALNDIELNGGTLTSTTGHTSSSEPFTPVYGAWNLNGAITSTGTSTISTSDPTKGWIMLKVAGDKISNFNVVSGTLTVSAPVVDNPTDSNIGALTKSGTGTMVMSGVNTYTGATTVSAGTLALVGGSQTSPITVSSGASLGFTIGSPTTSTSTFNLSAGTIKITGTPSAASHTLITSSAGITGTPVLDSPVPGYQLKVIGNSLVLEQAAGYSSWAGVNGAGANLNDDHDNDGVPNGVEYFLGGPTGNTTGFTALPGVTNTAGTLSVIWVMGSGYAGVYNTDFTVETSDTLTGTWTTESAPGNVTISGSNVTYTFPTPLGTKRFARLKVTGP